MRPWRRSYSVTADKRATMEEIWACMYLNAYRRVPKYPSRRGGAILQGVRPDKHLRKDYRAMSQIDPAVDASNPECFRQAVKLLATSDERRCLDDMEFFCPDRLSPAGGGDSGKEQESYNYYHNAQNQGNFVTWNRKQVNTPVEMKECSTCRHPTAVAVLYESKGRQQCLHCKTYWHEAQRYGV